jgi:hypothetical protein
MEKLHQCKKKAAVLEYLIHTRRRRNFMITNLVANVMLYYELLALDARLSIIDENLAIQNDAQNGKPKGLPAQQNLPCSV